MKLYFAPLEGISWYLYRNLTAKHFEAADVYVTPFIAPNQMREMRESDRKDILPENNKNLNIIPQLIGNRSDEIIDTALQIKELGYKEINLNFGCPSGTVVAKNKGSGMLRDLDSSSRFLTEVFDGLQGKMNISIKTRVGMTGTDEWEEILDMYNQFPICELIIHPRIRKEFYNGTPHRDTFEYALYHSKNPLCYNGDIFTKSDYDAFISKYHETQSIMIGRGALANPAIFEQIRGTGTLSKSRLKAFLNELLQMYKDNLSGDKVVLQKMKEIWRYEKCMFDKGDAYMKKIGKANSLPEYQAIVNALFAECALIDTNGFYAK